MNKKHRLTIKNVQGLSQERNFISFMNNSRIQKWQYFSIHNLPTSKPFYYLTEFKYSISWWVFINIEPKQYFTSSRSKSEVSPVINSFKFWLINPCYLWKLIILHLTASVPSSPSDNTHLPNYFHNTEFNEFVIFKSNRFHR